MMHDEYMEYHRERQQKARERLKAEERERLIAVMMKDRHEVQDWNNWADVALAVLVLALVCFVLWMVR